MDMLCFKTRYDIRHSEENVLLSIVFTLIHLISLKSIIPSLRLCTHWENRCCHGKFDIMNSMCLCVHTFYIND